VTGRSVDSSICVIGEALVDVVRMPGGEVRAHPGGSPANVAVGLARLGVDVELLTRFGDDEYGNLISAHLASNAVRVSGGMDASPTSVAEASIDASGKASYDFRIVWTLSEQPAHEPALTFPARCIHTGSIAATLQSGADTVHRLITRSQQTATISYDPNCRPSLMGAPETARPDIEAFVALADVVKASDEDIAWLYPGQTVAKVARHWLDMGPALVVITRGADGHYSLSRSGVIESDTPAVTVADTVGAGDSFMAALLAGLLRRDLLGADRRSALRSIAGAHVSGLLAEAGAAAAITCSRPGADPPTRQDLADYLAAGGVA
jgi:fructokinase